MAEKNQNIKQKDGNNTGTVQHEQGAWKASVAKRSMAKPEVCINSQLKTRAGAGDHLKSDLRSHDRDRFSTIQLSLTHGRSCVVFLAC
jgi:hypothetical protein